VGAGLIEFNERVQPMRLATQCLKLSALVGLLGISVWSIGCADQSAPTKPTGGGSVAPAAKAGGGEAGSSKGGGVDVPDMPADTAKPEAKEEPKADEAKKEEPKADEAKAEEAK
jgi:hypothetical protein